MPGCDALEADAEPQPPNREFAQAVARVRGREGHTVVGANRLRQAEILEGALEDTEGIPLLRGRERFAGEQVPRRVIGDGERIAIALIAEQELPFVVGAPERVRLGWP